MPPTRHAHRLTPVALARAYGVPHVIDYGPGRAGSGLLITTGAGLLMADMDQLLSCRWAVDLGAGRHHPRASAWLEACAWTVSHVAAHLWLSITSSVWMTEVLSRFPADRLAVLSWPALTVGQRVTDVGELQAWSRVQPDDAASGVPDLRHTADQARRVAGRLP